MSRSALQRATRILVFTVLAMVAVPTQGHADEITAFVVTSIAGAYRPIVEQFEKASGHIVRTTFGSGQLNGPNSLIKRLNDGERPDVIILTSDAFDELRATGVCRRETISSLMVSRMGVAVKKGAPKPDISTLDAFRRTLLGASTVAVSSAASGVYITDRLFPQLGIAAEMKPKQRTPPSGPVAVLVARGEAEIALQQIPELVTTEGVDYVGPFPPGAQRDFVVLGGVTTYAAHGYAARALLDALHAPAADAAIRAVGMDPAPR